MGDCPNEDLLVNFDSRLKLKSMGSQGTTDAGLLAYRELDAALGLTEMASERFTDLRQGSNKQHQLSPVARNATSQRECLRLLRVRRWETTRMSRFQANNRLRWARAEKICRNLHHALDAGGGRVATIATVVRLDWVQAQRIWEMSAYEQLQGCLAATRIDQSQ